MSGDYQIYGYDKYMRKVTALKNEVVTSIDFEGKYEIQSDRLNASKVNLINFIKRSDSGTALGTFNLSQALNLTSSITYNKPKSDIRTFGKPAVAIYQGAGTASADQIYPIRGANVTLGRYDVVGGEMDYANYTGTSDQWRAMIIDTNGTSTQVITFATQWIFVDYQTDNVT